MKKILITGSNSYVGVSFKDYLALWPEEYEVDEISTRDDSWKTFDFSPYDAIYHVAGIAHIKETAENAHIYYEVNRDLAIQTANKAKIEGVKQFVFLSTMSIYGMDMGIITKDTVPNPKNNYAKSKLQAEEGLEPLADDNFKVTILRPPMVYGKGCKGNFQTMIKLVKKLPFFPRLNNQRSLIYVDNLSSFVKKCIDGKLSGIYFPQNQEYMNTTKMACWIAESLGKKVYMSWLLGLGVKILQPFVGIARKGYGSLIYKDTEIFSYSYCVFGNKESVNKSV